MAIDYTVKPKYDVPLWSETRWQTVWNPDESVGIYIHTGRMRGNIDLWWIQAVAHLPNGKLAVDRSWVHNKHPAGVHSDIFDLTMTEEGWTSSFDGAAQMSSIEELGRRPVGSSAPMVPMKWSIENKWASPLFDMYAVKTTDHNTDFASDMHVERTGRTTGELVVDGKSYKLDGVGLGDHSAGIRDWTNWRGHEYAQFAIGDLVIHGAQVWSPEGEDMPPFGTAFRGDKQYKLERFELPRMTEPCGGPLDNEMTVQLEGEEPMRLRAELIHTVPVVFSVENNDNCNGIDWEYPGDPIIINEGVGRYTLSNGEAGYGFFERSVLRSQLTKPDS